MSDDKLTFTLDEVLRILRYGRTAVNFSHVPSVSRAIDWQIEEFREALKEKVDKLVEK